MLFRVYILWYIFHIAAFGPCTLFKEVIDLKEIVAEGKTKIIVGDGKDRDVVYVISKDDITAGDGKKREVIDGKGAASNETTCNVFELLKRSGIPTHYLGNVDSVTFLAKRAIMLPFECVTRRIATGSYMKRNPDVKEGEIFKELVFEMFLKDDERHDPIVKFDFDKGEMNCFVASKPEGDPDAFISKENIDWNYRYMTPEIYQKIEEVSRKVFNALETAWSEWEGELIDLKIEFGFVNGELVVCDVIDNDSWRLSLGGKRVDKQSFRDGSKPTVEIQKDYKEVARFSRLLRIAL